jgi:hypothetical protein
MSTTTLYVELLIIAFEVLVWLAMLLDIASTRIDLETLFGQTTNNKVPTLLFTALVLGLAYLLGIMVDKFAKWVMENPCSWLTERNPN